MSVIIETSLGDITIDLFTDERPKCKYTGGIMMPFFMRCHSFFFYTVLCNVSLLSGEPI